MISRFQTAVDYGISPSLFPEPEDDTYDFFEKIETPEGPRVVDVRKRVISTTSNIPQKRRRLQVDSSSRFSSRASLHIQPPSFLARVTAAPTSPPSYNPLTARSPTPVRRPPPAHVAPPSHSPTPVRVLRDISDYTKYGETLLDRPQEEELEQPIDLQEEEEEEDIIPSPVFSPSPEASPPPPIHRPLPARSPQHDRVLRDITKPMDKIPSIAKDTDTDISYVDRKGKEAAPVEIDDEEETEADVLHFVKRVAEGATFENDIANRASSFIEKELIVPSNVTEDPQKEGAVAERQTSDPIFDQDAKQALDRLLMEQDQEDQAEDELIQEKENFVPVDDTIPQKDPVAVQPIYPDLEETQPAGDEEEEEVITTIFDDDEREMDMLFLDEVERMPSPFQRDEDSQLRPPIEKQRTPSPDLDEQPLVNEPEIEEEEAEKEVEEVNDEQSDEDIEEVQPRRSSTPSRILESIFDRKENEEIIADEADVASDRKDLEEAGEMDIAGSDEEQGVEVNLSVAAEENYETLEDKEPSQIASPVEQESKLPPMSPVTALQNRDTITIERRESYRVSEYEEELTLDQMLMDHRLHRPTREEYIEEDHFQEDDEDDIYLDPVQEDANEEDLAREEHDQDEPTQNEIITEDISIVKEHTHIQDETVDQNDEVDENDEVEAEPGLSISRDSQPTKEAEIPATVVDEEERNLDMTLFEEVEGMNTPHHDDEDSQPRSPVQDQRSPSPEAYHGEEHKEKAQARSPPSPSPDHEEQALDRLLLEEVDAFGSAESIVSLEKENKAIASPEPSFYATRTPSPVEGLQYHERLQSGYSGQPRSALEVIRDTLSQNQLPTPPRSSPNISVTKGQDVLLKKMETTDLNRSFAQLHASYTSTRQNRTEPRREANEMDVVSEAIGQVMAPYQ